MIHEPIMTHEKNILKIQEKKIMPPKNLINELRISKLSSFKKNKI